MRRNCLPMRCPARVSPPAVAIRPPAVGALRPDALRSAPRMSQGRCRADRLTSASRNALILQLHTAKSRSAFSKRRRRHKARRCEAQHCRLPAAGPRTTELSTDRGRPRSRK